MKFKSFSALAPLVTFAALSATTPAFADPTNNPSGLWRTVDDSTGKERSVIRIESELGVLSGRVMKSLDPKDSPDALCTKCPGARKDKAIVGMAILTGLQQSTADVSLWEGGEILDPDSGSVYRARAKLSPDGRTLEVRGFVGVPLFGRTQVWKRGE